MLMFIIRDAVKYTAMAFLSWLCSFVWLGVQNNNTPVAGCQKVLGEQLIKRIEVESDHSAGLQFSIPSSSFLFRF